MYHSAVKQDPDDEPELCNLQLGVKGATARRPRHRAKGEIPKSHATQATTAGCCLSCTSSRAITESTECADTNLAPDKFYPPVHLSSALKGKFKKQSRPKVNGVTVKYELFQRIAGSAE